MSGPGPDMSGPGPDRRGPGPDRRGPGPDMSGPGPDRRGPGPDRRGPGPDRRGPGPDRRGPGPDMRGPGPDMRDTRQDMRGQSPDMRGPHSDMTCLDRETCPEMQCSDPDISPAIRGHFQSNNFVGPRGVNSLRFQRLRGPRPLRSNQPRGLFSGHCAVRGQPRFDSPQPVVRPLRHKAGLLPTPPEGLISLPNNSPDAFLEDQWQNSYSPEIRRTSHPGEDCEIRHYGDRKSQSEDHGHCSNPRTRGNFQGSASHLSQERLLPENKRDRDRGHGRLWNRVTGRPVSIDRAEVRGRELNRPREVEGENQKTSTERDKDIVRAKSGQGDANRDPSLHKLSLSKDSDRDKLKDGSGKEEDKMGGNIDLVDSKDTPQTDTPQKSKDIV
ncbi:hypothetical protein DPEC_G00005360 [Dallia pectoralis]|uniref:Uncharacterized protein n=1 Tax=Dallia pectoralis TaxID=75939 RepID=A0ACC2HKI5_DALPE|nr:hypothetical protein DPEC_G00005360 [Dallia pectoralis]